MELIKHLNKCAVGADIDVHMLREFGVRAVREGDLVQFKYTSSANWQEPVTHECRGVILRETPKGWVCVSRPFDKFFNYNQGHVATFDYRDLQMVEKADGTCIQVWWDGALGEWRASTLGSIPTTAINDLKETFAELFWRVSGLHAYERSLAKGITYIFELISEDNQIVTKYKHNHVVYLGGREVRTGEYICVPSWVRIAWDVRSPHLTDYIFTSQDDALEFVERESHDHEAYGQNPEGFVGYVDGHPVVKFKNMRYMQLHAVGGGDLASSRKRIREAFFEDTLDDIREAIPTRLEGFLERLTEAYRTFLVEASEGWSALEAGGPYELRKQYARAVKAHIPKDLNPWAFQRHTGDLTVEDWIRQNRRYEKIHRFAIDQLK